MVLGMEHRRGFITWLLGREPHDENAPGPSRQGLVTMLTSVVRVEALPMDPPAQAVHTLAKSLALIVRIEELPKDTVRQAKPASPFLKWLLWPERIPSKTARATGRGV